MIQAVLIIPYNMLFFYNENNIKTIDYSIYVICTIKYNIND